VAASLEADALGAPEDAPVEAAPDVGLLLAGAAGDTVPAVAVPAWAAPVWAALVPVVGSVFWPAVPVVAAVGCEALVDWFDVEDPPVVGVVSAAEPLFVVVASAGAGWPVTMGLVVVGDVFADALPAEALPDAAGAVVVALDPAVGEAGVVVVAALGGLGALSGDFWVSMPKPRITAATMVATTANPNHRERFTEPRFEPLTRL
jgi:hypothetical protein